MEMLVKQYERPVYNAAFRLLGNRDDAFDATQNTFLKAFSKIDQFDPKYKFFSWMYRIALNESINMGKRVRQTEELSENSLVTKSGPEDVAIADDISDELQLALNQMNTDHRSVIILKYFSGCSYQEMADTLEIPVKTVKSRLYSARRQMKSALEAHGVSCD